MRRGATPPATQTSLVRPTRRGTTPPATQTHIVRPTRRGTTPARTTSDSIASRPADATENNASTHHQRLNRLSSGRCDGEQRQNVQPIAPQTTQTHLVRPTRRGTPGVGLDHRLVRSGQAGREGSKIPNLPNRVCAQTARTVLPADETMINASAYQTQRIYRSPIYCRQRSCSRLYQTNHPARLKWINDYNNDYPRVAA